MSQFEDLQACYLKLRKHASHEGLLTNGRTPNGHGPDIFNTGISVCPWLCKAMPSPALHMSVSESGLAARYCSESDPGDSAPHELGMANGNGNATGAVVSSDGLSEFSRMLSVFINCSKLKASNPPKPCLRPQPQTDIS